MADIKKYITTEVDISLKYKYRIHTTYKVLIDTTSQNNELAKTNKYSKSPLYRGEDTEVDTLIEKERLNRIFRFNTSNLMDFKEAKPKTTIQRDLTKNFFEFKNTIQISNTNFDFRLGSVAFPMLVEVTLYSTYNCDLTLKNINQDVNLGIDILNFNIDDTLPKNGSKTFIFKVWHNKGKTIIDNRFIRFHFKIESSGKILSIPFRFCFARFSKAVFSMFPDRGSYKETYSYFSKSFKSLAGREDVISFMDKPRLSFSASYSNLTLQQTKTLEHLVLQAERPKIQTYMPMWTETSIVLTRGANISVITLKDYISPYYKAGGLFIVVNEFDELDFSLLEIDGVNKDKKQITTTALFTLESDKSYFCIPVKSVFHKSDSSKKFVNPKDNGVSISVREKD